MSDKLENLKAEHAAISAAITILKDNLPEAGNKQAKEDHAVRLGTEEENLVQVSENIATEEAEIEAVATHVDVDGE